MTRLADIERFLEDGFCEYRNCTENEQGYCSLWVPVNDMEDREECFVAVDGSCAEACLSYEYCKSCGGEKELVKSWRANGNVLEVVSYWNCPACDVL